MAINRGPLSHDHDIQIFSPEEIGRRRDDLLRWMKENDVDAVVLHAADSVYYLSGVPLLSEWGRPMWFVQKATGEAALIGSGIERENMMSAPHADGLWYDDSQSVVAGALDLVSRFLGSAGTLGLERGLISRRLEDELQSALSAVRLMDVGPQLSEQRLVKSPEEVELLCLAGDIARIGADAFLDAFKEGVTELHVASAAVHAMNVATAALAPVALSSTYAYCQTGQRTLTPHLHPGGRRIRRGDVIGLNVFPTISGYCVELERTFVFGTPTDDQARALDASTRAFDEAKQAVRIGVPMSEVDALATEILVQAGYGDYIRHGTGHAHGIMIGQASREEYGELRAYNDRAFLSGIACSVEPAVFIPDVGAFRHSDVLIVGDDGVRCITEYDVRLAID